MPSFPPRVLIADQDPDWCGFLANLIRGIASQRHLLAYDFATVQRLLRTHPVAVCLIPADLVELDALAGFQALRTTYPNIAFVLFINDELEASPGRQAFLQAGAVGVMTRDQATALLPEIIQKALSPH